MNLTVSWSNYNGGTEDGVRIYRDVAPIPDTPLSAPIATLAAGATTYNDGTVTRGTKYYYRIGIFKGSDEFLTKNKAIKAVSAIDTGPGPQTLAAGDWDLGFFGLTKSTDLITTDTLASTNGLTIGTVVVDRGWLKVAYKGKVLFIAKQPGRYNVSYNNIYSAGLVYGTNDNGAVVPSGVTATNQYKPIMIAGTYLMIPRLLQGLPVNTTAYPTTANFNSWLATDPGSNEWDDLMGILVFAQRWTADTNYGRHTNVRNDLTSTVPYGCTDYCQIPPLMPNTNALTRGGRADANNALYYPGSLTTIAVNTVVASQQSLGGATVAAGYTSLSWRPVLELVL